MPDPAGQLGGKVAIITGGAFGIGLGMTRAFVAEGCRVLVVDIREEAGDALQAELGDAIRYHQQDITLPDAPANIRRALIAAFGETLDVLVNNAQASRPQLLMDIDQESFDLAFKTGPFATFALMREFHGLLSQTRGSIINFASGAGLLGMATHGAYAMAKEAIRGLTRTAANEWGKAGIRVNVICPAAATEGYLWWRENYPDVALAKEALIPLGYVGEPQQDIAPVAVFLASDASRYMTGQTLMADGGSLMLR
jgi:NAD(P)-dependent dehydrogenase (short-subunit alcohol dehydrogenase family)